MLVFLECQDYVDLAVVTITTYIQIESISYFLYMLQHHRRVNLLFMERS